MLLYYYLASLRRTLVHLLFTRQKNIFMPIFKAIQTETIEKYLFIEADTQESDNEIASNNHIDSWYDVEHNNKLNVSLAEYEELPGETIVWDNDGEESEYEFDSVKHTPVQFLIEKEGEGVWAYFPCEKYNDNTNLKQCYAHVSQHSSCYPEYAKECKEATQNQYRDLLTELTVIGYTDLKILNKDWNTTPEPKEWEVLWDKLGEIPVDEDERIEESFLHFEAGTDVEDIWHWFEGEFDITLGKEIYKDRN